MTEKRMTKRDYFNELLTIPVVAESIDLVDFIEKEIANLDKRKSTSRKPTKKQIENAELVESIYESMEVGKQYTCGAMLEEFPCCEGLSSQKVNAMLKKLVDSGRVEREVVKRVTYFTRNE